MKTSDANTAKVLLFLRDNCETRIDPLDDHSIRRAAQVCDILDMLDGDGEVADVSSLAEYMQDLRWGFKTFFDLTLAEFENSQKQISDSE